MKRNRFRRIKTGCRLLILALLPVAQTPVVAAEAQDTRLQVVTTFTVIADIAANVAGNAAVVHSITKPGAEIHDYQPTPQDIVRAQSADLILWNGMNLERWFERFLQDVRAVPSVLVTDGIVPLSIYAGPYDGKPNPHAWMSASNGLIYVDNIRQALVQHDPDNAAVYNANASAYSIRIAALGKALKQRMAAVAPQQRWLLTSEGAFSYLARDLDMKEVYLWPVNAEQQGTPQQIRRVIDRVRRQGIPVIFSESTISDRPARQVARETGIRYGGVLYVDSLSQKDGPVPSYIDLLEVTLNTIVDGFLNE
ncbi:iron-binding protein [Marinobacterium aestuarii]|uniref:Iron-binding protein n=1 Tax=Marinobacterium aestuarii TaxID=1821621 RepID=A0A1A9F231_9GAMM|nr:metal ABC transporter substrate-binding protein [Marinobacterium aestuarii]ANG63938.1 iron-binding protein [Marinobacterium aestuarii]